MSASSAGKGGAPKRPLSSYNLFFLLERKRIIEGTDRENQTATAEEVRSIAMEHESKPRRRHRRSHGRITFKDLARTLADRWKTLDKAKKAVFEKQAKLLWVDYEAKLREWQSSAQEPATAAASSTNTISEQLSSKSDLHAAATDRKVAAGPWNNGRPGPRISVDNKPNNDESPVKSTQPSAEESEVASDLEDEQGNNSAVGDISASDTSQSFSEELNAEVKKRAADDKKKRQQTEEENASPKKQPRAKPPPFLPSAPPCAYRFDPTDAVVLSNTSLQFCIRGKPRLWEPHASGYRSLELNARKADFQTATKTLFQHHQQHGRVPKFSADQKLSATLVFALPASETLTTPDIKKAGNVDCLVTFVMQALEGLLFSKASQIITVQARKKFDMLGGTGYTSIVLEVVV